MEPSRFLVFLCSKLVKPNASVVPIPAVGAVIVKKGFLLGKGHTQSYGNNHAEVSAIDSVTSPSDLKGASLYVTLTPCSHYGKTPPCIHAIKQSGISKVFIGTADPTPDLRTQTEDFFRQHKISFAYNFPEKIAIECVRTKQ